MGGGVEVLVGAGVGLLHHGSTLFGRGGVLRGAPHGMQRATGRPQLVATETLTPAKGFQPTVSVLPGGTALKNLVNGIGGWALILALAGLVIGAAMWALGAHSQNYQQSFVGKRAVLVSGLAALIVGAAPAIIDFFFHTGHGITPPT